MGIVRRGWRLYADQFAEARVVATAVQAKLKPLVLAATMPGDGKK
jgi:hypothetical protein